MDKETLEKFIKYLNPKITLKVIRVYSKSFKIVYESKDYKSVLWCHFPISDVKDTPKWRQYFRMS